MEPMRLHHTEREFNAMRRIYDGLVARAAQDVADKKGKGVHFDYVVGFNFFHGLEGIEPRHLENPVQKNLLVLLRKLLPPQQKTF